MNDVALRASGRIKWFDTVKGFGFLVVDGLGDVLVHASKLREHDRKFLPDGAICEVDYVEGQHGLQASKVHSIDLTYCAPPRPLRGPKSTGFEVEAGPFEPCEVKSFSRNRGFGFLIREDGTDAFVHMEMVRAAGLADLTPGRFIHARIGDSPKGPIAMELRDGR